MARPGAAGARGAAGSSAACRGIPAGEPPRIVSPDAATPYRVRREAPPEYQRIPLVARAGPGRATALLVPGRPLVATRLTGRASASSLPCRGAHRLVVTDDLGRSDGVTYRVE